MLKTFLFARNRKIHFIASCACLSFLLAGIFSFAVPVHAGASIHEEKGSPVDMARSFIDNIIPEDSEMYVPPTETEFNRMKQLVSRFLILSAADDYMNLSGLSSEASALGYEPVRLTNGKSGETYYFLREIAGQNKGRGLFIFRTGKGGSNMVIEAPHPIYDHNTDIIGAMAFEQSKARAFLLAGAHRKANLDGSADVAHSRFSMFEAVHEQLVTNSTIIIQIHGFSLINEPDYPQIVLSSTGAVDTFSVSELSSILEAKNFSTGIANGGNLRQLEGSDNFQGKYAALAGATFIHMEIETSVRNNPSKYKNVIAAISEFGLRGSKKTEEDGSVLRQEIWYYLLPGLAIMGAFIYLLMEKRNSKIQ